MCVGERETTDEKRGLKRLILKRIYIHKQTTTWSALSLRQQKREI